MKIIKDWEDDLIWCPSQCYLRFNYGKGCYVLYLRWRHSEPWSATLIKCKNGNFNISDEFAEWNTIDVGYFRDDELDKLKEVAVKKVKKILKNVNP